MKTPHEIAVALAVAAILFFIIGFTLTGVLLLMIFAPHPDIASLASEAVVQYLLGIVIFEAASALPCAIISFAIKMAT